MHSSYFIVFYLVIINNSYDAIIKIIGIKIKYISLNSLRCCYYLSKCPYLNEQLYINIKKVSYSRKHFNMAFLSLYLFFFCFDNILSSTCSSYVFTLALRAIKDRTGSSYMYVKHVLMLSSFSV